MTSAMKSIEGIRRIPLEPHDLVGLVRKNAGRPAKPVWGQVTRKRAGAAARFASAGSRWTGIELIQFRAGFGGRQKGGRNGVPGETFVAVLATGISL